MPVDSLNSGPVNRRGRLLVASPALTDPNFVRTVLLMLEHSAEGALGLVLNRPTTLVAGQALPGPLAEAVGAERPVFQGGPVQPEAVILLADFVDPAQAASLAVASVGVVDPGGDTGDLRDRVRAVRAYGGYAGWGAGQLEREIAEGAWMDVEATVADVFAEDVSDLWRAVVHRKGGAFRALAQMPDDPSVN
ncbi:MAG: YqgE/AlgH family protein [Thermoleophilia bacterium]